MVRVLLADPSPHNLGLADTSDSATNLRWIYVPANALELEKTLNPFPLLMIAPDCEPTPEMRRYGVLAPDISSELFTSPDEIFEVLASKAPRLDDAHISKFPGLAI